MTIRNKIKLLLNKPIPGEYAKIRKDDIFLVSFPKSGNTWLRFLIGNYLYENIDFNNVNKLMPDIHVNNNKQLNVIKKQRFIKSHFTFNPKYPKVIYIKRNIKDVCISYFYWWKKRDPNRYASFSLFFDSFIDFGSGPYGTWIDHIKDWTNNAKKDQILIINYENIKKNTYAEMLKVLSFCKLPLDEKRLLFAIEKSNIKNMSNLESRQRNSEFFKSSNFKLNDVNFIRKNDNDRLHSISDKQLKMLDNITKKFH